MKTRIGPIDNANKGKEAIQVRRLITFSGAEAFGFVVSAHPAA
jgi:hypothetical protein